MDKLQLIQMITGCVLLLDDKLPTRIRVNFYTPVCIQQRHSSIAVLLQYCQCCGTESVVLPNTRASCYTICHNL